MGCRPGGVDGGIPPEVRDVSDWTDAGPRLIGLENVETWDEICVVADEADMAAVEITGWKQVIAFSGSVDALCRQHADNLGQVRRVTLALPSTPDGRALQERLARRFGRHRCWLVEWPENSSRADQTAVFYGSDAVAKAMHDAKPYPIEGLYQITAAELQRYRDERQPQTMTTGTPATDAVLALPTEGRLVIVTGYPGSGKSEWTRFVAIHTAARERRRWLIFSPEMQPWQHFVAGCAQVFHNKPFWPRNGHDGMAPHEIKQAADWMRDRIILQVCDAEDKSPTLDWLLEGARDAVLRHGITDWLIDPYNEIDHQRSGLSEAEYHNRNLQRFRAFTTRHGVNAWIAVHPKQPPPLKDGESRGAPTAWDINGGAAWNNKADLGVTVHSPVYGAAQIILWKAKFLRFGKRGERADLLFDPLTGRYRDNDPNEGLT